MQKYVVLLLAIIVSFAAGYFSHPVLNHNQTQTSSLTHQSDQIVSRSAAQSPETLTTSQQQVASSVTTKEMPNSVADMQPVESGSNAPPSTASTPSLTQETNGQETATTGNTDSSTVLSEAAIRDIKQWQSQHKQALKELVNNRVPENFAEGFFDKATENNAFFDEVQENLNPERNDQWNRQMEQRLSDMIQTHELSNSVELFSVTCKQSTCELVGKAFEVGNWTKIYMSMIRGLFQAGEKLNLQKGNRVTYLDEGQEYFYSQLVFE